MIGFLSVLGVLNWLLLGQIGGSRDDKLLSLFAFVKFPNGPCNGISGTDGTCLASGECLRDGGSFSNNCASGFGVCCVFTVNTCGATVTRNCTYVDNPNFPSAFTTDTTCNFAIRQVADNICYVRLDMVQFNIAGPDLSNGSRGACSDDSFQAMAAVGRTVPQICGANTGQHMYLNAGFSDNSDLALNFNLMGGFSRTWHIKVLQIPCGTLYTPEPSCLMYLTGISGQVRSFNFVATERQNQLINQNFEICLRQEEGFCQVAWSPDDESSFQVFGQPNFNRARAGIKVCNRDFVLIPNGHNGDNNCMGKSVDGDCIPTRFVDRYCGKKLNCIELAKFSSEIFSDRFTITYVTDANNVNSNMSNNRGFALNYRQIPC